MPTNFVVNAADLAYILKQIKIGEATSIGYTPTVAPVSILQAIMDAYGVTAANAAQLPAGLRTVDGTFNNLLIAPTGTPGTPGYNPGTSEYGAADTLFPRLTDPVYNNDADGDSMAFGPPGSGAPPPVTNTNYANSGNVADADPRIISNLIVDMSVNNPAAIAAFFTNPLALAAFEAAHPGKIPVAPSHPEAGEGDYLAITNEDLQTIPNQSPDVGLSPSFNSWMTYFGQFFDHGLDLVTKGNAGTVYIPLQDDDPLIAGADGIRGDIAATSGVNEGADDLPAHLRFMALTRATQTLDANGIPQHENTTTSFIDQNQTYTSHSSHQVFLREYVKDANGHAVSTGKLLDGTTAGGSVDGAMGNWGEVKEQALEMLGIKLGDFDVHNVPLLVTDQYGKFIPGANGYAQMVMKADAAHNNQPWVQEGTAEGITTAGSIGTGHAFLDDIAHHAAPAIVDHDHNPATPKIAQVADSDPGVGDDGDQATYDDEMLNAHFITGDGRGNENIALTTVHSVFHSEHNRTVDANKATIIEAARAGDIAFLNEWLTVDVTSVPADTSGLVWDGERLFQAARFSTEMQYQHLVFEEFARRIQPMVDPFVFNNSPEIDPSIVAEFAHTVYRFGHSMLTGTVDRLDNNLDLLNGDADQATLLAVFLNPQAYIGSGASLDEINANIIRGLSRDVGNAMDEFIVTDVRSNLLGLPLDLGALNIARGRDTGIPSLNETRAQLYNDSALADLKPYESWVDFAAHMKNAASVVNFIAAYGNHAALLAADVNTLVEKRAVAEALVFGGSATINAGTPQERVFTANNADRLDFVNATGIYAPDGDGPRNDSRGGLQDVDLWIGGLAEASPEFGGMLGSTFNYVFEAQMEDLQNGDRLYYLTRTQGLNFINQLEPNTFADLVMRNTDLGDQYSTHLSGALFITPDYILELDRKIAQEDYNSDDPEGDPDFAEDEPHSPFDQKVTRTYTGETADGGHDVGGTLRFIGGEHVVLGGTEGNDKLYGDIGDDTLWGDGGNDYLNGGTGADDVFGGTGNDIIEDGFGDDVLRGQDGNDVITSARGFDLMFGGDGSDVILLGQDMSEVFGGSGNDFILGGEGADGLLGNEGDDWMEGGAGFDSLSGDNSELFFNSPIIGHDVLFAQSEETDYDAESGDDIMLSGSSVFRYEGMFGFDWSIAKGETSGVAHNLRQGIFAGVPDDVLRDRFDKVEALSGYNSNDILEGDDRGSLAEGGIVGRTIDATFTEDLLTQEGIDRIDGFNQWFGGVRTTMYSGGANALVAGSEVATTFRDGNILMGGDGNDLISGRGGFDLIDGDAYLNVRIGININGTYYSAESLNSDVLAVGSAYAGRVYKMVGNDPKGEVDFSSPAFGGRSLTSLLLDRTITPGQMSIVREIKYDATHVNDGLENLDTATFFGNISEYTIEGRTVTSGGIQLTRARDVNGDGFISVQDRNDGAVTRAVRFVDDTDFLKNIEVMKFADQSLRIGAVVPPALDLHAFDVVTTTINQRDEFTTATYNNSNGTTAWNTSWTEAGDNGSATTGQIQINTNQGQLRFIGGLNTVNFDGASITRAVSLSPTAQTTLTYSLSYNNLDVGDTLTVAFSTDNGATFTELRTHTATAADQTAAASTFTSNLNGSSTSLLRFTVNGLTDTERFNVDNVNFTSTTTAQIPANDGINFTSTFTEDGAAARIALNSSIVDLDGNSLVAAMVRLTNAQALDVLSVAGALPAGITASFEPAVPGQITLILSGLASHAAYQTAIEAVRFSNTSQNPSVTPRVIEVTVSDGSDPSLVAVATVNVVSVNDAPVAVADTIITNIASGNISVLESVLLANDTDVEGNQLDVTAVSAAAGLTGLSLATLPGSVTFVDDATAGGAFTYTASDGALSSNARVTVSRQGAVQVADNFQGSGGARSAANNSTGTVAWTSSWTEIADNNNIRTGQIQIDGAGGNGTNDLRFLNGDGASIQRGVDLSGASGATLTFDFDKNGIDAGESVRVQFAADGVNFVNLAGGLITNTNGTNASGNASGTLTFALTGGGANSAIRLVGSAISTAGEDIRIDNLRIDYTAANAPVTGTANSEVLLGNATGSIFNALGGADQIIGGAGDDTINAGAGDDTITWSVGDGRDFIDGGANGVAGDRIIINGSGEIENYVVYARAEAIAAGVTGLNDATEIVVTRNGVANVVAELDNVEEITINTGAGDDSVTADGNFGLTSLFFNTITVNGGGAGDRIDGSQLTSAHRLVLNQNETSSFVQSAQPVELGFGGISQDMVDALPRNNLPDRLEDAFIGSRQHGAFGSAMRAINDQGGLPFNATFAADLALDFAHRDFGFDWKFHERALHFDAADHLMI